MDASTTQGISQAAEYVIAFLSFVAGAFFIFFLGLVTNLLSGNKRNKPEPAELDSGVGDNCASCAQFNTVGARIEEICRALNEIKSAQSNDMGRLQDGQDALNGRIDDVLVAMAKGP